MYFIFETARIKFQTLLICQWIGRKRTIRLQFEKNWKSNNFFKQFYIEKQRKTNAATDYSNVTLFFSSFFFWWRGLMIFKKIEKYRIFQVELKTSYTSTLPHFCRKKNSGFHFGQNISLIRLYHFWSIQEFGFGFKKKSFVGELNPSFNPRDYWANTNNFEFNIWELIVLRCT